MRPDLLQVPPEIEKTVSTSVPLAAVDVVNEVNVAKVTGDEYIFKAQSAKPFWLRGWAYDEAHKAVPGKVWLELVSRESAQRIFIPLERYERLDVAEGFKHPWAKNCGLRTQVVSNHNIQRGAYSVNIYQAQGESTVRSEFYPKPKIVILFE